MIRETLKNIIHILTLTCDQAARYMSESQETSLNSIERKALFFHLLICRFCRKYRRQLKFLRSLMTKLMDSNTYEKAIPHLMEPEEKQAFQERLSKKLKENPDLM
jgi:hypothetical protein